MTSSLPISPGPPYLLFLALNILIVHFSLHVTHLHSPPTNLLSQSVLRDNQLMEAFPLPIPIHSAYYVKYNVHLTYMCVDDLNTYK